MSCSCYPCLAEQAGCSALRLSRAGLVHLSRPSSISASQHKPQRSLGRDGAGYTPLIHTDALHLSRAAACWPGWPVQPPWQGDKAPHTRGANCMGHVLTARHVPWSWAQRCRTGPSCELTRNTAFSVLLWMQKAEAGSVGYLETSNPLIFFTFIGALGPIFANCWEVLPSQCVPSALTGPSFGNQQLQCKLTICKMLPRSICAKSPHPYLRPGTEEAKQVCIHDFLAKHFLAVSFFKAVSIFGSRSLQRWAFLFQIQCKDRWKVKAFNDAQFECWQNYCEFSLHLTFFSLPYLTLICLQDNWCSLGSLALVRHTHPGRVFWCFWITFFEFALKLEAEEPKRHATRWKIPGLLFHAEASRWCLLPLHMSWRNPTLSVS